MHLEAGQEDDASAGGSQVTQGVEDAGQHQGVVVLFERSKDHQLLGRLPRRQTWLRLTHLSAPSEARRCVYLAGLRFFEKRRDLLSRMN